MNNSRALVEDIDNKVYYLRKVWHIIPWSDAIKDIQFQIEICVFLILTVVIGSCLCK